MSPAAKASSKWVLTSVGSTIGTLLIVITATVRITTEFNKNNLDHTVIKQELRNEQVRSADAQANLSESYYNTIKIMDDMRIVLDSVKTNQTQVMTNQNRIQQDIQKISDKMGSL